MEGLSRGERNSVKTVKVQEQGNSGIITEVPVDKGSVSSLQL